MKVLVVGRFGSAGSIWKGFSEGIEEVRQKRNLDLMLVNHTNKDVVKAIRRFKPSVTILLCLETLKNSKWVDTAREHGSKIVHYLTDLRYPKDYIDPSTVDLFATTGYGLMEPFCKAWNLKPEQAMWLPLGCLRRDDIENPEQNLNMAFLGSQGNSLIHGRRLEILNGISKSIRKCFINNYSSKGSDFELSVTTQPTLYRQAKVCFDCSTETVSGYTSDRIFSVTGVGGLYYGNYFEKLESMYDANKEIFTFDAKDHLGAIVEKCSRIIKDKEASIKVAKAGFKRAQSDHTYYKRFEQLFTRIAEGL